MWAESASSATKLSTEIFEFLNENIFNNACFQYEIKIEYSVCMTIVLKTKNSCMNT